MLRRALTILSLVGLLISLGLGFLFGWHGAILPLRDFSVLGLMLSASLWLISVWKSAAKTLTIVSLVGLLFSVSLWLLSFWAGALWTSENGWLKVTLSRGALNIEITSRSEILQKDTGFLTFRMQSRFPHSWLPRIVPSTVLWPSGRASSALGIVIPLWIPAAVSIVWLCVLRYPHSKQQRRRRGLCLACGYNLHGLTEPRCPECGEAFDENMLKKNA